MSDRFLICISFVMLSAGCAQSRKTAAAPRAEATGVDYYNIDDRHPVREFQPLEFYYKKCSLDNVGSRAGVGRSFECSAP